MAGPGGRERGRVSVRVVPDVSGFAAELRATLTRVERTLRVQLGVSLDVSGLVEHARAAAAQVEHAVKGVHLPAELDTGGLSEHARAAVAVAQKAAGSIHVQVDVDRSSLNRLGAALSGLGSSSAFTTFARTSGFAALGITALAAAPQVLTLAASLSQVAGVGALLPGVLVGAAAGVAVLAIGFQGFGAALKTAKTPAHAKAVADALKNLSPNAREAASAIRGLGPQFTDLRKAVQENLFVGVGAQIKELARSLLPELQGGLAKVAGASGTLLRGVLNSLSGLGGKGVVAGILGSVSASIAGLLPAVQPLVTAFATLAKVGSSFLPGLAAGFANVAGKFGAFIAQTSDSGALRAFIQGGIDALKSLAGIAVEVGRVVGGIFAAAQAAGGGGLENLRGVLTTIADVINGPAFQTALTSFFAAVGTAAGALAGALPAIGAAIVAVMPTITTITVALGTGLAAVLTTVADLFQRYAPQIASVADVFARFAPQILLAVGAFAAFTTVAGPLGAIIGGLGSVVSALALAFGASALAVTGVIVGVALLAAGLVVAYQTSQTFRDAVSGTFAAVSTFVTTTLVPAVQGVATAFQGLVAVVVPIVQQVVAAIQANWGTIGPYVTQAFTAVKDIIVGVLGIIAQVVNLVTSAISFVWSRWGAQITAVVVAVFGALAQIVGGALSAVAGIVKTVLALLQGNWSGAWEAIKQVVAGVWQTIKGIVSLGVTVIGAVISGGLSLIRGIWSGIWSALTSLAAAGWSNIRGAFSNGVAVAVAVVRGLPGLVLSALGNLGSLLFNAGASLIQGLADGVKSRIQAVISTVSGIASKIKGFFGGSPVEEGPLLSWNNGGAGKHLIGMLAAGLSDTRPIDKAMTRLAGAISTPKLGVTAAFDGGQAGGVAGGRSVNIYGPVGYDLDSFTQKLLEREQDAMGVASIRAAMAGG